MRKKTALTFTAGMLATLVMAFPPEASAQGDNIYLANLKGVQEKVVALAEAIPADKYSWRPADGVRSVSEALMHIAAAHYFFARSFGVEAPADVRDWEKTVTTKADVITKLKASFDAITGALAKADMSQQSSLNAAMGAISHGHEHMGQMIAYARSNGVVPPWSR